MQIHSIKREHPNKKARQVGRGGTRGKTSGRGGTGQTARAGNKRRPQLRDIIKKLPKLRGYRFNSIQTKPRPVNLESLNIFADGSVVDRKALLDEKLIKLEKGKMPKVKILAQGEISKKLSITDCLVSLPARVKIEKAGGSVK